MSTTQIKRVRLRDLGAVGYVNGLTHWSYKAGDDTAAEITSRGYWDEAVTRIGMPPYALLAEGDWIFVSGHHWALQLYVMQATSRVVVGILGGVGALGELPAPDYPDDYQGDA